MRTDPEARRDVRRALKLLLVLVGLVFGGLLVAGFLFFLAGRSHQVLRVLVVAGVGLGLTLFGIGFFRQFVHSPPPEEPPEEVPAGLGLAYVCEMCGLDLAVVAIGSKQKAPKHCGEEMVLIRKTGAC